MFIISVGIKVDGFISNIGDTSSSIILIRNLIFVFFTAVYSVLENLTHLLKIENLHFAEYTQNYSANISSTMSPPEAILYSK